MTPRLYVQPSLLNPAQCARHSLVSHNNGTGRRQPLLGSHQSPRLLQQARDLWTALWLLLCMVL